MGCTAAQSFIHCWNSLGKRMFQIPSHSLLTFSWISLAISGEIWKWYVCKRSSWLLTEVEECFSVDAAVPSVLKVAEMWTVELCETRGKEHFSLIYHYCYLQYLLSCAELNNPVKSSGKHKNVRVVQHEIQFNLHYACLNLCLLYVVENCPETFNIIIYNSKFLVQYTPTPKYIHFKIAAQKRGQREFSLCNSKVI